ncbi:alpha/beta hydrolase [Gimesia chilikensis]|uniref:Carboxylesterase NlhH n=1 Tax=Gimesia chilikensis TaxID=2605989 RepID=A0A517PX38_9PLAN|nr:alpha/beta hydrolase [Gimesia chilikensis]QDT23929.1 Carboxylesterase NlhH [Gimesia chilikensis]
MHRDRLTFIAILLTFTVVLSESASAQQPRRGAPRWVRENADVHRNLEYAEVDGKPLLLDLYLPKGVEQPPLLVWIHGGGWRSGDKGRGGILVPLGLQNGYACASINYRLSGEATFPAQIHDCKAAIRWLRAHAKEYGYDATRIGVGGSSAGGHLVALLGTSGGDKQLEGTVGKHADQSSQVQAVLDMWGPTDFLQMDAHALPDARFKHNDPRSPESLLLGGPVLENKDKVAQANPITYIDKQDPPFLIIHGSKDPLVPVHQSQLIDKALKKAKVPVQLIVVEGAGHGGREFNTPETNDRIVKFLDQHVKQAPRQKAGN